MFILCGKKLTVYLFYDMMSKQVKNQDQPEVRHRRATKTSLYIFKAFWYTIMLVYGYIELKDSPWLPWYIGGNGSFENMFPENAPFIPT